MAAILMKFVTAIGSPQTDDVRAVLLRHFQLMRETSPEESCHVMDPDSLLDSDVVLMGVRSLGALFAVGGLKKLTTDHAELKSMHTVAEARGQGVGQHLLTALLEHARASGLKRVSLETGSADLFQSAHRLYAAQGFRECPPFGDYALDPLSVFMTRSV
jgi:putative acetyltransferase|tara:strand:- start:1124 stop:1600 length:477 start_codon:yes stop_codon:yes gene_type:complete